MIGMITVAAYYNGVWMRIFFRLIIKACQFFSSFRNNIEFLKRLTFHILCKLINFLCRNVIAGRKYPAENFLNRRLYLIFSAHYFLYILIPSAQKAPVPAKAIINFELFFIAISCYKTYFYDMNFSTIGSADLSSSFVKPCPAFGKTYIVHLSE